MAKRLQETQRFKSKKEKWLAPIPIVVDEHGRHIFVVNQHAPVFRSPKDYRRRSKHKGSGWDD